MPLYEHVFLARQEVSPQQVEAMIKEFGQVITDGGGTVGKTEYWGLKSLAYKIKKSRKAHYALMNIEAPAEAVAEMERRMGLSTDILRFLTLRVDAHEAEPSVQMRKGEDRRDGERGGFRGDRGGGLRGGDRSGDRGGDRGGPRPEGGSTYRARPTAPRGPRPQSGSEE
jgi:small subunit ribosomal protein S6